MAFLNSIWLWSGLAAAGVAVPILIHLLNRFRHRRTDWAAMELLRRALVVRARQVRLEDLLLLLLRCLALLLVAFAMARPTLIGSVAAELGGSRSRAAVIALDVSFSMDHTTARSRLERARQRIAELAEMFNPGDRVTVMLLGVEPRVLSTGAGFDPRAVMNRVERITTKPVRMDPAVNLPAVAERVAQLPTAHRECYLISDLPRRDWADLPPRARQALEAIAETADLFVLPVAGPSWENLSITTLEPALRQGRLARYVADVRNHGQHAVTDAELTLTIGERTVARRTLERIGPGQTVAVPLTVDLDATGAVPLRAELARDDLLLDNQRHAVAYVRSVTRVLLVDGDPGDAPFTGATDYLAAALQPRPGAGAGPINANDGGDGPSEALQVERVDWTRFDRMSMRDFDVIALADVVDLSADRVAALDEWVRDGGGLIVFPGDNVQPEAYNRRFTTEAGPLLPARLEGIRKADAPGPAGDRNRAEDASTGSASDPAGWLIEPAARGHRLARVLEALPNEMLAATPWRKRLAMTVREPARAIWRTAGSEEPVLAEQRVGRGRVLLFGFSADRSWSDLPITPLFVMTLHEAIDALTRPVYERSLRVGEPARIPLMRLPLGNEVTMRRPDGEVATFAVSPAEGVLAERGYAAMLELDEVDQPGIWRIGDEDSGQPLLLAANVDPAESATEPLPADRIEQALGGMNVTVVEQAMPVVEAVTGQRIGRQLWTAALLAALLIFITEALLAHWFSHRMDREGRRSQTRWTRAAEPGFAGTIEKGGAVA